MTVTVPDWLKPELFIGLLEKNVANFERILKFSAKPALGAGENYLSILWAIEIEASLKDASTKTIKYMLKVPPQSNQALALTNMMSCFKRETISYYDLLPAFEEMYKKAGKSIKIAPKAYKFDKDLGFEVILMEDLRVDDYKTMNRLEGLDMVHTEWALTKLAQFHAASAAYIAEKGGLPELIMKPMLNDEMFKALAKSQKPQEEKLMANLSLYKTEHLKEKILKYQPIYLDQCRASNFSSITNPEDFYVFSHGDCWSNNIMFQHDAEGHVKDTLLVDFQAGRYTNPALDLQYFILTSTCLENKLKYFDYFVQYYHQQLEKHLRILNYPKHIPSLKDVHRWMFETSFTAYTTILKALPVVLLDPNSTKDISADSMMGENSSGSAMQHAMYTNEIYSKQMEKILPWLENRGYFE